MVSIPGRVEKLIPESENEDVFHHLLSEVMVDTEDLVFSPVRFKRFL